MGFIDKVLGAKRATIDRLEGNRIDNLIRTLGDLGATVDRNEVRLYSADPWHDKASVVIEAESHRPCLPSGVDECDVRIPVALVDGLLFAAVEYRIKDHSWSGTSYSNGGVGVFLVRYSPCIMRLKIEDKQPLTTAVDLANRLERIVGKSFKCRHMVMRKVLEYGGDWRDQQEVLVDHPCQVEALPPLKKPEGWKDGSRP